jgi:hypothetical protein
MAEADQATQEIPAAAPATGGPQPDATVPPLEDALRWVGFDLDEVAGVSVAKVKGVYVDQRNGAPCWLAIRFGRFGKHSAVPYASAAAGVKRVWVPYPGEVIKAAPLLQAGKALLQADEAQLCSHYALVEGRAAEIETLPPGTVTAVPRDR